jgi:hypothetical protein
MSLCHERCDKSALKAQQKLRYLSSAADEGQNADRGLHRFSPNFTLFLR